MNNVFLLAPDYKKKLTLAGIFLGVLTAIFTSGSLSTLLSAAAADIGGVELFPLASTISGLISIAAMPLFGYIGAKNPAAKRPLVSLSLFAGAAVLFLRAIAPSMEFIVFAGIFYGLVSAGLFVLGFTMIRDMYEPVKAGLFLGMTATMNSVGTLIGPFLTGLIIDKINWRMACHIVWPMFLASALMILFGVRATRAQAAPLAGKASKTFDFAGTVALIAFLGGIVFALSLGPISSENTALSLPFGSPGNNLLLALSATGLIAFILILRKKQDDAIVPIRILKDRNTVCLVLISLIINFSTIAVMFFTPTYVLYVMHRSATEAGLTVAVHSVIGVFISPMIGRHIARVGNARGIITIGTAVRIAVTLCFIVLLNPDIPYLAVCAMMFIAGFYRSQHAASFSTAPQIQIAAELRVLSNSVIQLAQNIGAGIGLSVYTMVISFKGVADGIPTAFMIAAAAAVGALVIAQFLRPLPDTKSYQY